MTSPSTLAELDRQIALLVEHRLADPAPLVLLRDAIANDAPAPGTGNIPFCIVVNQQPFPAAALMDRISAKGARGVVDMTPFAPEDFHPIAGLDIPADVYLLWDIDTGTAGLNLSPEASLISIREHGRTPLTLEEGVMATFFYPALLTDKEHYNCIQMAGSRRPGDQRVPSIWFSKRAPRLGWCWDRNVHTWLATASAARRLTPRTWRASCGDLRA